MTNNFDTLRCVARQCICPARLRITIALSKEVNLLRCVGRGDVGMSIDETTDVSAANVLLSIFAIAAGKDYAKVDDIPVSQYY
ncbi:MAG: hypothetical protein ACLVL2_01935 [Bacteroides cellulosilyticus]